MRLVGTVSFSLDEALVLPSEKDKDSRTSLAHQLVDQ
jgi:hypothetical protein